MFRPVQNQKLRFLKAPANAFHACIANSLGAPLLRQLPWKQGTIFPERNPGPPSRAPLALTHKTTL
ncbi:hypothetical protein [Leptolyngbya sp. BC1307]|uniref:hypothetical protein n=1 Tax=Leptolyngbya sp. BC1307 TaxID=2029589 RepID=UPI000EFCA091|nr:hypothetical protein [Leptolyngbya sp. BC1307]